MTQERPEQKHAAQKDTAQKDAAQRDDAQTETIQKESGQKELQTVITAEGKGKKKILFVIAGIAVVLVLGIALSVTALSGGSAKKVAEQLNLGNKYLDELDFERAIKAYEAVLEIDPKNAEAYLGLVESHIRNKEFEKALQFAEEGFAVTGDERLEEKIKMLKNGDIFASNGWIMKMTGYDGDGNCIFWHEYTYNIQGEMASVTKFNAAGQEEQYLDLVYDENGRQLVGFYYDDQGNILKVVNEYSDDLVKIIKYNGIGDEVDEYGEEKIDSEGRTIEQRWYDKEWQLHRRETYEYENEKLVKISNYGQDDTLRSYYVFTYIGDKRDKQLIYNADGQLSLYIERIYDENGDWVGTREYDGDGKLQQEIRH